MSRIHRTGRIASYTRRVGAAAVLVRESLAANPGGEATTEIRVRNTGTVVDQFSFQVLGPAGAWATFEPASLSLFPGDDATVAVRFAPPRDPRTRAGSVPFGVRVFSSEDPQGSVVVEGEIVVGRYVDTSAELLPRTTRGRRSGRHQLTVTNRGNGRLRARLVGVDPDDKVRFVFDPPDIATGPGGTSLATVEVLPRRRFLRGAPITHVYRVRLESRNQPPVEVDGALLQDALIPRWVPKALLALAALALAWLLFLRPAVESTAKTAVEDTVGEAAQLAASQAVAPALASVDERLDRVEAAAGLAPGSLPIPETPSTTAQVTSVLALGDLFDLRLESTDDEPSPSFQIADNRILSVTDLIFQNPAGDSGRVGIARGDAVLLEVGLETFRDIDYHFVSPLVFPAGSTLRFFVECANPPPSAPADGEPKPCSPALSLSGLIRPTEQPPG